MSNDWMVSGGRYYSAARVSVAERLPLGVYELQYDPDQSVLCLKPRSAGFTFPEKVYALETGFIDRVVRTWERQDAAHMGVLLNGIRGTGKTVTAKTIAAKVKLPVILVNEYYRDASSFLATITDPVVVMFDEFEKTFGGLKPEEIAPLLTLMDGVSSGSRKLFLLTSNDLRVNENFLDRPSRVRYLRHFERLSEELVREIVTDRIDNKNRVEEVVDALATVDMLTIDTVAAFVDEVNIHYMHSAKELRDSFNAKDEVKLYDATRQKITEKGLGPVEYLGFVSKIGYHGVGNWLYFDGEAQGEVEAIISETKWRVSCDIAPSGKTVLRDEDGDLLDDPEEAEGATKASYLYVVTPAKSRFGLNALTQFIG